MATDFLAGSPLAGVSPSLRNNCALNLGVLMPTITCGGINGCVCTCTHGIRPVDGETCEGNRPSDHLPLASLRDLLGVFSKRSHDLFLALFLSSTPESCGPNRLITSAWQVPLLGAPLPQDATCATRPCWELPAVCRSARVHAICDAQPTSHCKCMRWLDMTYCTSVSALVHAMPKLHKQGLF